MDGMIGKIITEVSALQGINEWKSSREGTSRQMPEIEEQFAVDVFTQQMGTEEAAAFNALDIDSQDLVFERWLRLPTTNRKLQNAMRRREREDTANKRRVQHNAREAAKLAESNGDCEPEGSPSKALALANGSQGAQIVAALKGHLNAQFGQAMGVFQTTQEEILHRLEALERRTSAAAHAPEEAEDEVLGGLKIDLGRGHAAPSPKEGASDHGNPPRPKKGMVAAMMEKLGI